MTEFDKGVALKATPLLMVFLAMLLASTLRAEATVIKDLRFGDNKGYVRMVLEFDRPLNAPPSVSINRNALQVALTGVINNLSGRKAGEYHSDLVSLDVFQRSDGTRIDAVFSFSPADVKTFSLTGPHRFIIDAYRSLSPATALPPVDEGRHIASIEETVSSTEPSSEHEKPRPAGESPPIVETSIKAHRSASSRSVNADDLHRNRFQQRLIAALIVVTSIIAVLLFLLIWMDNRRKKNPDPSWIRDLPPTTDRDIENIDAVIGEHLIKHDHR
jgi:hypothetical protein